MRVIVANGGSWLWCSAVILTGCASAPAPSAELPGPDIATEAEWRALALPRAEALGGAPTVTITEFDFAGPFPQSWDGDLTPSVLLTELAAAGLTGERSIRFLERRRFTPAAEAERRGIPPPPGQPRVGVSPALDYHVFPTWIPLSDSARIDVRLVEPGTGSIVLSGAGMVAAKEDVVAVARVTVAVAISLLAEEGLLPGAEGAAASPGMNGSVPHGVRATDIQSFVRGLSAEERWDWEEARRGFGGAARDGVFYEAVQHLARTARLRMGGTLAEN